MTTIPGSPPIPHRSIPNGSQPRVVSISEQDPELPVVAPVSAETEVVAVDGAVRYVWGAARLMLGWIFLWPFLDKLFGLHHETASADAWIHGGSPTSGFLSGATGPFAGIYHSMSGSVLADWGFMLGLLCIGVALIAGVGVRVAAVTGSLLLVLMWSAALPPANNPFMDDHLIYAVVLCGLAMVGSGTTLGFGRWWSQQGLARDHAWLR